MFSDEIYEQVFPRVEEPKTVTVKESMIDHVDDTEKNVDQVDAVEQELTVDPPAEQAQETAGDNNDSGNGDTTG